MSCLFVEALFKTSFEINSICIEGAAWNALNA